MSEKLKSQDYFKILESLDAKAPGLSYSLYPKGMYFSVFESQKIEEMKRKNTLFLYALTYAYKHRNPLSLEQRALFDIIDKDISDKKERNHLANIIEEAIELCPTVRKCGLVQVRN